LNRMHHKYAGIDIGSRTIELVVVDDNGEVHTSLKADTGFDPMSEARRMLDGIEYDGIMATGYGRNLFELSFEAPTVTEIKAHACGVRALFPEARSILDIGVNDRCAAGTGKFLEIMARALGYDIESFGDEALRADKETTISSMCTVFAESEVTSLIAKGQNRSEIALGLHASVVRRIAAMIQRVAPVGDVVFTGGVAENPCMRALLEKKLGRPVLYPDAPQFTGALGAALLGREKATKGEK